MKGKSYIEEQACARRCDVFKESISGGNLSGFFRQARSYWTGFRRAQVPALQDSEVLVAWQPPVLNDDGKRGAPHCLNVRQDPNVGHTPVLPDRSRIGTSLSYRTGSRWVRACPTGRVLDGYAPVLTYRSRIGTSPSWRTGANVGHTPVLRTGSQRYGVSLPA